MLEQITSALSDSINGFYSTVANFIPDLVIALIMLLVGWIISRVVRWIVEQIATRIKLDKIISGAGLDDGLKRVGFNQTPTNLVGTIVFWMLFLNFLLSALKIMRFGDAVDPLQQLISSLPNLIVALITFVLGTMFAQFVGRAVSGTLGAIGLDIHETLGNVARLIVFCAVFIITLQQVGLDVNVLTNIFVNTLLLVIGGIAIAFGIGGRTTAKNVLAGFYARETFSAGDELELADKKGTLESIGTVNSEIRTEDGSVVSVPNTDLTTKAVVRRR